MTLTTTTDKYNTERIRIYCSRSKHNLPGKSEYMRLSGFSDAEKKKIWAKARKRDKELKAEYHIPEDPWNKEGRNRGPVSTFNMSVKGISLNMPPVLFSKRPDWRKQGNVYKFNNYFPFFNVFTYTKPKAKNSLIKPKNLRFRFSSNKEMKKAYLNAVDALIESKPHFECYRDKMEKSCPKFKDVKEFMGNKYIEDYGVSPWE